MSEKIKMTDSELCRSSDVTGKISTKTLSIWTMVFTEDGCRNENQNHQ